MTNKQLENNNWLKMHQITAFWHGFGLSNGLALPEKDLIYDKKNKTYTISREYMRYELKQYIKWLEQYKESWNTETHEYVDNGKHIITDDDFAEIESDNETRMDILKMINLLQK